MKLSDFLGRFVYTRKCAACSELMSYDRDAEAFCAECRAKWEMAKVEECKRCGKAVCECVCMARALEASGALCHHKLVKYSLKSPVVHHTIMYIKKNKNHRVTDFLASQLCAVLLADEDLPKLDAENCVVAYVPRSRSAVIEYGHDQSELLAKAIANKMGVYFAPALKRKRRWAVAQKKLNAKQRAQNVKKMFELDSNCKNLIDQKIVLLVDDIVTTGASMGVCASVLIRSGVRLVICLSVAYTPSGK